MHYTKFSQWTEGLGMSKKIMRFRSPRIQLQLIFGSSNIHHTLNTIMHQFSLCSRTGYIFTNIFSKYSLRYTLLVYLPAHRKGHGVSSRFRDTLTLTLTLTLTFTLTPSLRETPTGLDFVAPSLRETPTGHDFVALSLSVMPCSVDFFVPSSITSAKTL